MTTPPLREIGRSGLHASLFSLGSWHTYDRMDFADAVALLREATDRGVNLFDVGVYSAPGAPPVFTDVIFSAMVRAAGLRREEWLLSSKLWLEAFGADGFRPQLENALMRVGVEHADLVILGDLRRDDLELRDLVLDLAALADAGLIRAWGVNNWSAASIQALIDLAAAEGVPVRRSRSSSTASRGGRSRTASPSRASGSRASRCRPRTAWRADPRREGERRPADRARPRRHPRTDHRRRPRVHGGRRRPRRDPRPARHRVHPHPPRPDDDAVRRLPRRAAAGEPRRGRPRRSRRRRRAAPSRRALLGRPRVVDPEGP